MSGEKNTVRPGTSPERVTVRRMKPKDREVWILAALPEFYGHVDVLSSDFVDAYIEATGAAFRPVMWGAFKCAQLGRDLSRMACVQPRPLQRWRCGLSSGAWQPGFPKWVWSYSARQPQSAEGSGAGDSGTNPNPSVPTP